MAVALWKMQRLDGLERRTCVDVRSLTDLKLMDSLWRQQARMERSFHKAIEQLQRLRKALPAVHPQPSQTSEDTQAATTQISTIPAPPALVMHAVTRIPHQVSPLAPPYVTEAELNQQSQFDASDSEACHRILTGSTLPISRVPTMNATGISKPMPTKTGE
jgi:hypothetical protein